MGLLLSLFLFLSELATYPWLLLLNDTAAVEEVDSVLWECISTAHSNYNGQ